MAKHRSTPETEGVVNHTQPVSLLRREATVLAPLVTAAVFLLLGHGWEVILPDRMLSGLVFAWLFAMIVVGSVAVVRHADGLAALLGEPFGTMILTLSVASIEILTIAIVMTTGDPNPTLARDTMFSVVMIVLNGLVGLALLLGGLRYREQEYNLQGVTSYLSVIAALAVFGLIVPNFTETTPGPTFSRGQEGFLIVMCLGLYCVFLAIQTTRHRTYFIEVAHGKPGRKAAASDPHQEHLDVRTLPHHAAFLVGCLALVIYLAEKLAVLLNNGLDELKAPPALGALLVAVLVLAPEGLGGIYAARANRMQRAINILLGSVLATLSLTIPSVVIIGLLHGTEVVLGLDRVEMVMLALTLIVSMLTFGSGRTNVLQGAVHVMLFLAYLMLILWR
jgi:Ca2+:H+ antiporter